MRKAPPDTLTAAEAADRLGVKRTTLYTYASRGWLRSSGVGRARRYVAADVDELAARSAAARGHGAAAAWAMRFGPPVLSSAIGSIHRDGPHYRGHPAVRLAADGVGFERVAELLWTGQLPERAAFVAADLGFDPRGLAAGSVARVLRQAAAALPPEDDPLPWGRAAIRRLLAAGARAFGPEDGWERRAGGALRAPTVAEGLLAAIGAPSDPARRAAIDRALVLCADHELNASTFAARIAASTGADGSAFLTAAVAAWDGPAHGAASEIVEDALAAGTFPAVGFGHALYPSGDPRAAALLVDPPAPLRAWLARAAAAGRPPPTLDVGLVGLAMALDLPRGAARLVFAIGRSAGWLAHGWEQRASGTLLRPRAQPIRGR